MDKKSLKDYFDILEIDAGASIPEVRNAYNYLKALYSGNSVVISSVQEEFDDENRREILDTIEEAYQTILKSFEIEKNEKCAQKKDIDYETQESLKNYISQLEFYSGEALRYIRKLYGFDLREVAECTNISRRYLEGIEKEEFGILPQKVYLKGFIVSYAEHLNLDGHRVAGDLMKKYEDWLVKSQKDKYDLSTL